LTHVAAAKNTWVNTGENFFIAYAVDGPYIVSGFFFCSFIILSILKMRFYRFMRITAHPFRVPCVTRQGVTKRLTSVQDIPESTNFNVNIGRIRVNSNAGEDDDVVSRSMRNIALKSINESTGVGKRSDKYIVEVKDQFHRDMTDRED